MSVVDKLKFGKAHEGLNKKKKTELETLKSLGMKISKSQQSWLDKYNKKK